MNEEAHLDPDAGIPTSTTLNLHDFEEQVESESLEHEVMTIIEKHEWLTPEQVNALAEVISVYGGNEVAYGADFDIKNEINDQIKMVRAMRKDVLGADGNVRGGKSLRELKEVISASTTLTQLIMKSHETILNHDRQRAMETAMHEALKTLPKEAQDIFFDTLGLLLEEIS